MESQSHQESVETPQTKQTVPKGGNRKKGKSGNVGGAPASQASFKKKAPQFKDEVFLSLSVLATGRSPLDGWLLSLAAVAVTARTRRVLGLFERQLLPFAEGRRVEPTRDVADYLRSRRAAVAYCHRSPGLLSLSPAVAPPDTTAEKPAPPTLQTDPRVSVPQAMRDLVRFCSPFANLTLVCSPLFSTYPWINYCWALAFGAQQTAAPPAAMPWGHSGMCARSFASGVLGAPSKTLSKHPEYVASFDGFSGCGLPLADALAAAASFTHLHARRFATAESESASTPVVAPLTIECEAPAWLVEAGCVPCATPVAAWRDGVAPRNLSLDSAEAAPLSLEQLMLSSELRASIDRHADSAASDFRVFPSIADTTIHGTFVATLPQTLREDGSAWVASEKVHGANFTVSCDAGGDVWAGRRLGALSMADSPGFSHFAYVLQDTQDKVRAARRAALEWVRDALVPLAATPADGERLEQWLRNGPQVDLVCEMAGGEYPHPHVPIDLRGVRVQSGVYYGPNNFLFGIDIAVRLPADEERAADERGEAAAADGVAAALQRCAMAYVRNEFPRVATEIEAALLSDGRLSLLGRDGRYYLPPRVASDVFAAAGIVTRAEPLASGALPELLREGAQVMESTVATRQLGLPPLGAANAAEGLVIRPVVDLWVGFSPETSSVRGSRTASAANSTNNSEGTAGHPSSTHEWARVVFKHKHPDFREFAVTHKAQREGGGPPAASSGTDTESLSTVSPTLADFLTPARVEAVLSKHTEAQQGDRAAMVRAVLDDALKDAATFAASHRPPGSLS